MLKSTLVLPTSYFTALAGAVNAPNSFGVALANRSAVKCKSPRAKCVMETTLVPACSCRPLLYLISSLGMTRMA